MPYYCGDLKRDPDFEILMEIMLQDSHQGPYQGSYKGYFTGFYGGLCKGCFEGSTLHKCRKLVRVLHRAPHLLGLQSVSLLHYLSEMAQMNSLRHASHIE